MKRTINTLLISFSILYSQLSFAINFDFFKDKSEVYEKFSQELELKAEFTKLIVEAGVRIEKENPNLNFQDEKKLSELVQKEITNFGNFYLTKLNIPKEKHSKFQIIFKQIKWEKVNLIFKKAHLGIEFVFKKKGLGIGIAIMCGVLSEYLVPFALINIGLAKLIPLSMITPWSVIYSFVPNLISKIKIQNMLVNTLGDKEKVKAYLAQQDEINKYLKTTSTSDLIVPIKEMDQELEYLVVNQHPWWRNILSNIGFKPDGVSLTDLEQFIEDSQLKSNYTNMIFEDSNLNNYEKINLLTLHIFSHEDKAIQDNFRITFDSSLNKISKNSNGWNEIWEWTQKAKNAKSIDEIKFLVKSVPEQMTSYHLALIWENILLPEYIKKIDLSFVKSRKMVTDFELYKTKLNLLSSKSTKEEIIHESITYLNIFSENNFKGCKNNPQKIMTYLLSK